MLLEVAIKKRNSKRRSHHTTNPITADMNLSSIAVAALLSSFSITEARVRGGDADADTAVLQGANAAAAGFEKGRQQRNSNVCGPDADTSCVSTMNARSSFELVDCFNNLNDDETLPYMDRSVTILEYYHGAGTNLTVFKLTFPQVDFAKFTNANFNAGLGTPRFPAGIFYAESQGEVVEAVNCARKAGYKISPRGRGHSYQGLSSMDGYLVIDMSLMCVPGEFEDTHFDDDDDKHRWLLGGGQKAIGSIKSGSGCTNAVMLAYTAEAFPEGIYLIGSCPTVGITGYATGGGQGDTTPWVGLGIDDVLSYDIVLYDGTNVTANKDNHEDLYWALRGGGSGFGVITSLETAVISAPEASSRFTFVAASYKQTPNEARDFFERFQDFLVPDLPDLPLKEYKEKIRTTSAKFGGGASYYTDPSLDLAFSGLFLGSVDEAHSTFAEAGLLDPKILDLDRNVTAIEFSSYADAQLFIICQTLGSNYAYWPTWVSPNYSWDNLEQAGDVCEDLGIDSKYCYKNDFNMLIPNCNFTDDSFDEGDVKNVILPALKRVAIEPQSWFNRPGGLRMAELGYEALNAGKEMIDAGKEMIDAGKQMITGSTDTWAGGVLHGRLDPDVLLEIANTGVAVFHFAHGAPTLVERDATGYFGREEYTLLSLNSKEHYESIASILVNKAYDGDASKLRGFYNYLNYEGNRDWRNYYFGDNYERLSEVKAMYDETNGFGNPLQVEPALLSSKKLPRKPKESSLINQILTTE